MIIPFGLFEFNVMTFGLCNAAQSFQRLMDAVLRELEFAHCYIDDILVASTDPVQHRQHLRIIFERLRAHGLSINVAKCRFGASEVESLGYLVNEQGTRPLSQRIKAIQEYPKPTNISELHRFRPYKFLPPFR